MRLASFMSQIAYTTASRRKNSLAMTEGPFMYIEHSSDPISVPWDTPSILHLMYPGNFTTRTISVCDCGG